MNDILVIGYGNTIRGDDGAGVWVAEQLRSRAARDVDVLIHHGLDPELVDHLKDRRAVIFVDAGVAINDVTLSEISATKQERMQLRPHFSSPSHLLALCMALHGRIPERCYTVQIPSTDFALRESLTARTQRFAEAAVGTIVELVRAMNATASSP
jgi:hydrogenase maturation protease